MSALRLHGGTRREAQGRWIVSPLALSRTTAPAFMLAVTCAGCGAAVGAGMAETDAFRWVLVMCVLGSLTLLGWLDGAFYRIDRSWLGFLVVSGLLWQMLADSPGMQEGLERACLGAGLGFVLGAAPIAVAEVLGRRWPFFPGDAVLFASLGVLVGPTTLLWVLSLGGLASLARHFCVQWRRGRSWKRGHVALAPGMTVAAGAAFVVLNLDFVLGVG